MSVCVVCRVDFQQSPTKGRPRVTCGPECARKRKTALQRARLDAQPNPHPTQENAPTARTGVLEAIPVMVPGQCLMFWGGEQCGNKRLPNIIYCLECRNKLGSLPNGRASA